MGEPCIAISGAIGVGKADLAAELRKRLKADLASFGAEVRRYASEVGADASDRAVLQQLGQGLIRHDLAGFVSRVLAQAPGRSDESRPLVIAGIRHWEALHELKRQLAPRRVMLVNVEAPTTVREIRLMKRDGVDRRLIALYDNDICEEQIARILPQYAVAKIDGELPIDLQVAQVFARLPEIARNAAPPAFLTGGA